MCSRMWLITLLATFLNVFPYIEGISYFAIGQRWPGDQLLVRDEQENRHTGLEEVPTIFFSYAVEDPITYIEIISNENVYAEVNFSYYNALINGTVSAVSTTVESEKVRFKIYISIYGFNESTPELFNADILRPQQYNGALKPNVEPGQLDHMAINEEVSDWDDDIEKERNFLRHQIINVHGEELHLKERENNSDEEEEEEEVEEEEEERHEENAETVDEFRLPEKEEKATTADDGTEFTDKFDLAFYVGNRQPNDYLLYETMQTSALPTIEPANHSVTFYYIDNAFITNIQFVIFDYKVNKTEDEIFTKNRIQYSFYSSSSLKVNITDYHTMSLFVLMSIYGYRGTDCPSNYVSYVPPDALRNSYNPLPLQLRKQINDIQREQYEDVSFSFAELRQKGEEELKYPVNHSDGVAALQTKARLLLPLGIVAVVCRLWSWLIAFD